MYIMVVNCHALFMLTEKQTLEARLSLSTLQIQACLRELGFKTPVLNQAGRLVL